MLNLEYHPAIYQAVVLPFEEFCTIYRNHVKRELVKAERIKLFSVYQEANAVDQRIVVDQHTPAVCYDNVFKQFGGSISRFSYDMAIQLPQLDRNCKKTGRLLKRLYHTATKAERQKLVVENTDQSGRKRSSNDSGGAAWIGERGIELKARTLSNTATGKTVGKNMLDARMFDYSSELRALKSLLSGNKIDHTEYNKRKAELERRRTIMSEYLEEKADTLFKSLENISGSGVRVVHNAAGSAGASGAKKRFSRGAYTDSFYSSKKALENDLMAGRVAQETYDYHVKKLNRKVLTLKDKAPATGHPER